MTSFSSFRTIAAVVAMGAVGAAAQAATLPSFTIDPSAIPGVSSPAFTANNLIVSDYAAVTFNGGTFSDVGFLSIQSAQSATGPVATSGLNSAYGFYIQFTGSGPTPAGDPTTDFTKATFSQLSYTIYGYQGTASFGFSGTTPTTTATNVVALASGSLISGSAVTIPNGDGTFTPSGSAKLTLSLTPAGEAFFTSPDTFYNLASTAFSNTSSQVETFSNGFLIRQGGGSVNFASAVPEPGTYALLMAGVGVIGFVARRKSAPRR
ncbi:flocculation-associated PEP-CTERM protein PepA [Paucibacter sp. R3-3]|uniref:Flocculation-associated PEP-CTERM protein PepA n=1 Tax=Roseateles agri TaxID=3098619 RepID=A0ABU5DDS6_9BURK|nr:flocculation-associated PEP-CTERM protein PepA [Paucibacter sp. R3-3]MDY0744428.1 flocculation-associated PEP-CTERM protein PepA [Paucibacter sp. R3-3]